MQENRVIAPGQTRPREHDEDGEPLVKSRPVEVRELSEEARCVPCLHRGRPCHVQEGLDSCLQCSGTSTAHECIFMRKIIRHEHMKFFSWPELTGFNHYRAQPPATQQQLPYQEPPRLQLQYTAYPQGPPESHDRAWNYPPQPGPPPLGQPFLNGPMPPPKRQRTEMYDGQDVFGHSRQSSLPSIPSTSDWSSPRRAGPEYHLPEIRPLEPNRRPDEKLDDRPVTAPHERNGKILDLKPPSTVVPTLKRKLELEPQDLNLPHRCAKCDASFKTPAELKKHFARHEPQYFCNIPGCSRGRDGFTTKNDLDRHRKTMHKILSPNDRFWKCFYPDCAKTEKVWPRLDNFKAHIVRMHGQQYVQENVTKAEEWWDAQKTSPMLGRSPETTHDLVAIEPKPAHEHSRLGVTNLLQDHSQEPTNGRRRHLSAEGRQEAAQVREMGACLRCALLKEKCDDSKTCHRCISYSAKHFNGTLICRRGAISDYLGEIIPLFHNLPQPDDKTTGWNLRSSHADTDKLTFTDLLAEDATVTGQLIKYQARKNTFTMSLFQAMDAATELLSTDGEESQLSADFKTEVNFICQLRSVCHLLSARVVDVLQRSSSEEDRVEKIEKLQRTNLELREWYDELDNAVFDWKSRHLELNQHPMKKWNLFFSICAMFVMERLTVLLTRAWAQVTEVHEESTDDEALDTLCALLEFKFQRQTPAQHHFISMLLDDKHDANNSSSLARFVALPCIAELQENMAFLRETKGWETWRYLYERFGEEAEEAKDAKAEDSDDSDTIKVDQTAKPTDNDETVNGIGRSIRSRKSISKNGKEDTVHADEERKSVSSDPDAMSE